MDYQVLSNKKVREHSSGEKIQDLLTLTYIEPETFQYSFFRVPTEYIARPDLISIDHYGTADYVDVICKLNGISNPFELNEGMILTLPSQGCINQFYYNSDEIESATQTDENTATPKTKNEKRKVNEAVVGDQRFKINKELGVVIY